MTFVTTNFNTQLNTYASNSNMQAVDSTTLTEGYGGFCLATNSYYTFSFHIGVPTSNDIVLTDMTGKWIKYNNPYLYMNKAYPLNVYYPVTQAGTYIIAYGTQSGNAILATISIPVSILTGSSYTNNISLSVTFTSVQNDYGKMLVVSNDGGVMVIITDNAPGNYSLQYTVTLGPNYTSSI